jgi:UDP-2,3-diacylglucosamine pyrophosphatase LpxH
MEAHAKDSSGAANLSGRRLAVRADCRRRDVPTIEAAATKPEVAPTAQARAIFVSDVHLGCKFAQTEAFLAFLKRHDPQFLYLVGDILDGWRLKRSWHWRESYTQVMNRLFELGRAGTRIFYTPGNHDEFVRDFLSLSSVGDIAIANEFVHVTADGRRLLVIHGDQFDKVTSNHRWLSRLGDVGYNVLMRANKIFNGAWGLVGGKPVPFSKRVKERVKLMTNSVSNFEETLATYARERGCQGVVCGHIHIPTVVERPMGVSYYNTGDWVENRSALFELPDGRLEMRESD